MVLVRNLAGKSPSGAVGLIVLLGLILNLSGTWLPLIDRDEPRFAGASAEMLARQDWVVPWFNGEPRYDKPPLIYWAQIAAYECLGENSVAARLPSVLFSIGTALLIYFWTRRQAQPKTALVAAVIFSTCLQVLIHARLAVADLSMIFFVCAAQWSGWELTRPGAAERWRWWAFFYVSLALGFLAKGPVAWLPLGGLLLGRWLRPQAFVLPAGKTVLGLVLMLGLVALWGIPAELRTHGDFARVGLGYHVVYRSFGVMDGHGGHGLLGWLASTPFFLVLFFFSFFPWAFRVPGALRKWWPLRQDDIFGWYLLTQAGLVFLVFTLVRTKLPHYTLPAFPCLAMWLARAGESGLVPDLKVFRNTVILAVLVLVITNTGNFVKDTIFPSHHLFEKARPQLTQAMKFGAVEFTEPSLVWEFGAVVTNHLEVLSAEDSVDFMRAGKPALLILPTSLYAANPAQWGTNLSVVQIQGINFAHNASQIGLTALIRH
jgi:4-amino-4-deoxy-L-arabinose transferase-like glycosyltransferase